MDKNHYLGQKLKKNNCWHVNLKKNNQTSVQRDFKRLFIKSGVPDGERFACSIDGFGADGAEACSQGDG